MADYDPPMEGSPPPPDSAYPDIDETLHYPWQDSRQLDTEEIDASVIDPRLYQGAFPGNEVANPEEARGVGEDQVLEDTQASPSRLSEVGMSEEQDSEFVFTEDESER